MSLAEKLGRLWRRDASLSSLRNVRRLEDRRLERLGVTSDELNAKFALRVSKVEARVSALEADVLGARKTG